MEYGFDNQISIGLSDLIKSMNYSYQIKLHTGQSCPYPVHLQLYIYIHIEVNLHFPKFMCSGINIDVSSTHYYFTTR